MSLSTGPNVDELNLVEESITAATLEPFANVARANGGHGEIIPLRTESGVTNRPRGTKLRRYRRVPADEVALVSTELPGQKPSPRQERSSLRPPCAAFGNDDVERRCAHEARLVRIACARATKGADLISVRRVCVTDRSDVIPAAIEMRRHSRHFGMPVDPGNLLRWGA